MKEKREQKQDQRFERWRMALPISGAHPIILRGQESAVVYGCRKILEYSPASVILKVGKKEVQISGQDLVCTSFSAGAVTVEGCIYGVNYFERAGRKSDVQREECQ